MAVQHIDEDPCTTIWLPSHPDTGAEARNRMRDELEGAGLRPSVVADAQLVLTELVSNAVEHGHPDEQGNIEIAWCVHDDHLRISVHDGGTLAELRALPMSDASVRGRGLAIVDYLCDSWTQDHGTGTRVTAELHYA